MSKKHLRMSIDSSPSLGGDLLPASGVAPDDTDADDVRRQLELLYRGFQSFCDAIGGDPALHTNSLIVRRFSTKFKDLRQEYSLTFKAGILIINEYYARNPSEESLKSEITENFSRRLSEISKRVFAPIDNEIYSKEITNRQDNFRRLDEFQRKLSEAGHDGAAVRKMTEKFFPELTQNAGLPISSTLPATPGSAAVPTEAPETYQGLRGPETPPEFVKRVYGPWLGQGLTRADIRKLDPKLSVAITNWLSRPGNEWPADVDLPTKAEQNERLLSAGPEAIREHLGKFTGQEALREAARINAAAHYRK